MEDGRDNNACFSALFPVTWVGVHFVEREPFLNLSVLQSIRKKKKSKCALSSLQAVKGEELLKVNPFPGLRTPLQIYAISLTVSFCSCNQSSLLKRNLIVKNQNWTGRKTIWIKLSRS
jgi:hypothetical protein